MPPINIIEHAQERMKSRGISEKEVLETLRKGVQIPVKQGRIKFEKEFSVKSDKFKKKLVVVIADKIRDTIDVISVYAKFY